MSLSRKICFKCDDGKGHKMIDIWSYDIAGDVDELVAWVCPNCNRTIDVKKGKKK